MVAIKATIHKIPPINKTVPATGQQAHAVRQQWIPMLDYD